MTPLLELDRLVWGWPQRAFGGPWSASIGRGDAIAVLGPNGAGKTTLFRTLIGGVPPLSGGIAWRGRHATAARPSELSDCVAYVPQQVGVGLEMAVEDYVMLGCIAHKGWFAHPSTTDRAVVHEALSRLGIAALATRSMLRISGGERQLAGIARALAQRSPVLLLDEPTASLDFANQHLVLSAVRSLLDDGLAVVFSTHQPDHAERLASAVLAVDGKGVGRFGTPDAILREDVLSALYGVPVFRSDVDGRSLFSAGER